MVLSFELFNFGFRGLVNYIRRRVMEGEKLIEDRGFLAAPLTFFVVVVFQLLSKWLDQMKKVKRLNLLAFSHPPEQSNLKFPLLLKFLQKGSKNTREAELRSEIKQLLREASALSQ